MVVLRRNDFTVDGRVERQATTLGQRGLRVLVLAVGAPELPGQEVRPHYTLVRLPIHATRGRVGAPWELLERTGKVGARVRITSGTAYYYREAQRLIEAHRPRVVHCHDLDTLLPGVRGAARVGAKVIYDSAELWVDRNSGYTGLKRLADRARYRAMEAALIQRAHAVFTVSEGIVDELARRYGIARPILLRNVPNLPRDDIERSLYERLDGPAAHAEHEGEREPLLLHLGGIDMNRGLEQIVDALPQLPGRLILMGPARPYVWEPLQERARQRGVLDRIVHLPPAPREEIVAWARDAAVGFCTFLPTGLSHVLALPNKLFEYAFAGVPIVASDFPDMGRFVMEHRLGSLCDPTDPASIIDAVNRVLELGLGRRSPSEVFAFNARHCWEQEQEKLWRLYEEWLQP